MDTGTVISYVIAGGLAILFVVALIEQYTGKDKDDYSKWGDEGSV